MSSRSLEGTTVALTLCRAYSLSAALDMQISGLYVLESHEPADRSAGVHSSGWYVLRADWKPTEEDTEGGTFFVDDLDLWEQRDPKGYGQYLAEERLSELAQEDWEKTCA